MKTLLFINKRLMLSDIIKPCVNKLLPKKISTSVILNHQSVSHTTIDADDVETHSRLGKIWWDLNGPMGGLHSYNLLRVPFVRDGLVSCPSENRNILPLSDKKILDVGCGGGILSEALARLGAKVTGVDASKELIEVATKHSELDPKIAKNKPLYICETVEEHSNKFINHYDAVVASEIIEHVNNKELFIKSCIQSLKPGGKIFITTPNKTRITQVFGIWLAEYVISAVPRGTHQYSKFTTPTELTFLLERTNCHVELIHGVMFNPLSKQWTWVRSQMLMFAVQAVKLDDDHDK